jgi:SAM-dependent methyltransferase
VSVFDAYAVYYDLLYHDKDYAGEAAYIDGLIRRHRPGSQSVLELGCGTGGHAVHLARSGYRITGIDLSEAMVARATARAEKSGLSEATPHFSTGDLRTFRAGRQFDIVLALFHVMSYQTGNDDLQAAMTTAATHLAPGGLFIFDCWYGPGVLSDPPATRVRRLSCDSISIMRVAEPHHRPDENRVDVHYEILVEDGEVVRRIRELHAMRYLFTPEIDLLLSTAGMRRIAISKWLEDTRPDARTWNVCFVAGR